MSWASLTADLIADTQAEFGEAVVYTPQGGSPVTLSAPFDESHRVIEATEHGEFYALEPMVTIQVSTLPGQPRPGDTFTARGLLYMVDRVEPDGYGSAECYALRQDAPVGEALAVASGGVNQRARSVQTVDAQTVVGASLTLEAGKGYQLTLHAVGYADGGVIGSYVRRANARLADGVAVLSWVEDAHNIESTSALDVVLEAAAADVRAAVTGSAGSTVSWATSLFWLAG